MNMAEQMKMVEKRTVNGVNVTQLFSTIDTLKEKPELGKFKFRATNKWISGMHNRATVKDFYGAGQEDTSRTEPWVFDADEPPVLVGENRGANPVEYALVALSACLTTALIGHAAARGIKLDEVESKFEGDLDVRGFLGVSESVRNGYENVRVTFRIKADAPREKLQELVEVAQKRSPVFDIFTHPTPVSVTLET
ncbi:putative redox protein, regulator of disulfide bond formation [Candidatus Methanoperedens nitroreducens]|uniref:Putative redox protein, regulator of disulfide bond formation n=1 Tax=Candidatus Methanoperedens nitratireducens TaxID=1392998 RepID=A0A062V6Q6_9EURY|nr:OsmC family protein [Candidatus Methanoperedens nitroreducens]KCZ72278.1 putative redox protein, regulator of disulfide bond formation [Candidatus Methanoperedens nitroreducens]MDJ1420743.1 OsmC family protein [Candidatus Methanoperedens sp.]